MEAARKPPIQVRDASIPLEVLQKTSAWAGVPGTPSADQLSDLAQLLNRAPSPCAKEARKGLSLATAMLAGEEGCAGLKEQTGLAWAALQSVGLDEAVAVLRVERRLQPSVEGRPSRGPKDAPIVLSEWGDFECPYCVRAQKLVHEILESRDDVRVVFKHLPLSFHKAAMPAALAVEAAAEQGKFWEMHDALFELGKQLSSGIPASIDSEEGPVAFEEQAADVGLDIERYRNDYRSKEVYERVRSDAKEARRLGVNGTPAFFLDGRRIEERLNLKTIEMLIDKAKAEKAGVFSWELQVPRSIQAEADSVPADSKK